MKRISGQCDDFDNFDSQKCDLAKTCCVSKPETSVLYNVHENCSLFRSFWRDFEASVTILTTFWLSKIAIFERQSCQNRHTGLELLFKTGKQCAFHENCTKRAFQVMRSTFWPNRIFESQSCQNRHTGLKISPKRGKSGFSWTLYKTIVSGHTQHFGQIAFLSVKVVKIVTLAWLFKTGKECAFYKNCTKRSFQVMRSTFWRNRILKRQSCQNRHTGLKFSPKRGNSARFMKIVQNARFRLCAARFGQIAFLSVKVVKIVTLASNSLKTGKMRF